jgi:hypothetical protein
MGRLEQGGPAGDLEMSLQLPSVGGPALALSWGEGLELPCGGERRGRGPTGGQGERCVTCVQGQPGEGRWSQMLAAAPDRTPAPAPRPPLSTSESYFSFSSSQGQSIWRLW